VKKYLSVFGFFGGGGEADLGGVAEVFEDFAPGGVFGGATAMAFVDHDEVKEVGGELFVDGYPTQTEQFQIRQFCHHKLAVDRSSHCPALKSNFKADSKNPLKRVT
jgi:hypothetical protein